jgi:hypothetical protein
MGVPVKVINERIEAHGRINIDFGYGAIEEVFQGTARLFFGIEIEKRDRNLIHGKPLG